MLVKKQRRSSPKEAEDGQTKERGRKKCEPALCIETMRQQEDVSQEPVVRGDLSVSVGQLDSVLPPHDRQVRPLSRGIYQPDDSDEADVQSRPERGQSNKLESPSRGEHSSQGEWNATVTKEQKALDAQPETETTEGGGGSR